MKVIVKNAGFWYSGYLTVYCKILGITTPIINRGYDEYCRNFLNVRRPSSGEICDVIGTLHNSEITNNRMGSSNYNTTFYLLKMSDGKICLIGHKGIEIVSHNLTPKKYLIKHGLFTKNNKE